MPIAAAVLQSIVVAGALGLTLPAGAQSFPVKPARLIVPFPAGGPLDTTGRAIAQKLSEMWGQSVVVENKPGAGGNIGADIVAKSPPDGYTVVMGALSTHAVNPSLYPKMPYDAQKDFAPITLVALTPNVLVVNPSLPVHSVKELIAYAKANPGKLSFGSGSNGSAGHLAGELFKVDAGVDMVHIPYKGAAPAMQALLAGDTQLMFDNLASAMAQVKAGKLRALAVASGTPVALLPGGLGLLLYYRGLASTPASLATLAELAFPITGVLVNLYLVTPRQSITSWQVAGIVILWVALAALDYANARQPARLQPEPVPA